MSTYPQYKPSGIEWLVDIPEHWKVNRLKNITAKSIGGVWGDEPNEDGKDTVVVRVADFDRDKASIIDSEEFTYRAISEHHLLDRKLNKNDILLEKSGGGEKQLVGKAVIFDKDFDAVCANFIQKVEIIERFDKRFVLHVLTSIYDGRINFPYVNQTTGIQNLDITAFFNHCIAYPEFKEEQTAIANYLDEKTTKLDQLISNKKAQIDRLKEIRQIEINTAVTKGLDPNVTLKPSGIEWLGDIPEHWKLKRFRYCFNNGKGLSITKENLKEKGIPCVNYGEIHSKYGFEVDPERHPLLHVDEEYLETNSSSLLNYGDFVFADTSEDIEGAGNFTHLDSDQNIFAGYHTVISRLKTKAHPRFIAYCIDSLAYRTQIRRKVQGVKVYSITNKILKDTILWLPENDDQTAIANYLDEKTSKLDKLVNNLENQIEKLKEVRKIEIYNAVTGKIKVV